MKRLISSAIFAFVFALTSSPGLLRAETHNASPSTVVRVFYDALLDTMKQGESLGFAGRFAKLDPAVKQAFNLSLMARLSAGPAWQAASPESQKNLVEAFSAFSVANYASQFKKFGGERFEVLGEKPATGGGTIVETRLVTGDGETVTLNYLVRPDEKSVLRIVDVYLDASISQLAMRRSEFSSIIRQRGFDALIDSITDKNKQMGIS